MNQWFLIEHPPPTNPLSGSPMTCYAGGTFVTLLVDTGKIGQSFTGNLHPILFGFFFLICVRCNTHVDSTILDSFFTIRFLEAFQLIYTLVSKWSRPCILGFNQFTLREESIWLSSKYSPAIQINERLFGLLLVWIVIIRDTAIIVLYTFFLPITQIMITLHRSHFWDFFCFQFNIVTC